MTKRKGKTFLAAPEPSHVAKIGARVMGLDLERLRAMPEGAELNAALLEIGEAWAEERITGAEARAVLDHVRVGGDGITFRGCMRVLYDRACRESAIRARDGAGGAMLYIGREPFAVVEVQYPGVFYDVIAEIGEALAAVGKAVRE